MNILCHKFVFLFFFFFKYFIHLCKSTLFLHFAWLVPPRLVRWGLRAGQMDTSKISNSNSKPAPIIKTPPIIHACFVCFFASLTGFTFLFIFPYRQLAEQREGDSLAIYTGLTPAGDLFWARKPTCRLCPPAVVALFSLMCVWKEMWVVRFKRTLVCRADSFVFFSCFPQIHFEIWDHLTDHS